MAQQPKRALSQDIPEGFTPVAYVFRRASHTDALYGTRIEWDGSGSVRLVPSDIAVKMLRNHPDVYRAGEFGGQAVPPPAPSKPQEDTSRQELDMTIQTMDKNALESYARTHFGQELDKRRSVESLRQQVTLLIDQFGAP